MPQRTGETLAMMEPEKNSAAPICTSSFRPMLSENLKQKSEEISAPMRFSELSTPF